MCSQMLLPLHLLMQYVCASLMDSRVNDNHKMMPDIHCWLHVAAYLAACGCIFGCVWLHVWLRVWQLVDC